MTQYIRRHAVYPLTKEQRIILLRYFNGEIGANTAAKQFGCSHQQIINMAGNIVRHLAREGKLDAKKLLAQY